MSKQLPSRPHLRNLQNQAKRLLKGHRERKPAAVRVCVPTLTAFRRQTGLSQQYLMRVMTVLLLSLYACERAPKDLVADLSQGGEVADAVREMALGRFGPLARTILEHWGIHSTDDIGEIVFALVDYGVLIKEPTDSLDDFEALYTFEEAFEDRYPWSG